jgi:hypothetical protein
MWREPAPPAASRQRNLRRSKRLEGGEATPLLAPHKAESRTPAAEHGRAPVLGTPPPRQRRPTPPPQEVKSTHPPLSRPPATRDKPLLAFRTLDLVEAHAQGLLRRDRVTALHTERIERRHHLGEIDLRLLRHGDDSLTHQQRRMPQHGGNSQCGKTPNS